MTIADLIIRLEKERANTRFSDLVKICREYFGEPRTKGSHHIFKTPWPGELYQVEQVIAALRKLEGIRDAGDANN